MESTITTQIFNTTLSEKTHWAVAIFVSLAIIGFLPFYLYFAETSDWVLIVSYPGEGYPQWLQGKAYEQAKNALSTHTVFAAIWLFVLMSQAWAGATKGKRRRQFHVIMGKYISPFILIPTELCYWRSLFQAARLPSELQFSSSKRDIRNVRDRNAVLLGSGLLGSGEMEGFHQAQGLHFDVCRDLRNTRNRSNCSLFYAGVF